MSPLATTDWPPKAPGEEPAEDELIQSMFWDMKASTLDGWRPFSATLRASDLYGPYVGNGHGVDFRRNLMFGFNGPRGAAKTCSLSFNLAKILRIEKPVWTNYPISFYVDETNGLALPADVSMEFVRVGKCHWMNADETMSYYESMPLDMDKFYSFHAELRNGAVGIDELQYFCEARTSGKFQNRVLSYQIMQIRKTANTFGYTVQNQKWVDNRFGWSSDFLCEVYDVSKKPYDRKELGRDLLEGEISHWFFRDISGVLTGEPYEMTGRSIGPYQFEGKRLWGIYPTHYVIDVFEAMKGPDRDKEKKDKNAQVNTAIEQVANKYLEERNYQVPCQDFLAEVNELLPEPVHNTVLGRVLSSLNVRRRGPQQHPYYDFTEVVATLEEAREK